MTAPPRPATGDFDEVADDLFRELVLARTGIEFGPRRRGELTRGVLAASARVEDHDLARYADRLKATDTNSVLWDVPGTYGPRESQAFRASVQYRSFWPEAEPDRGCSSSTASISSTRDALRAGAKRNPCAQSQPISRSVAS